MLCKVMSGWKKDVKTIPEWLSWGRTVTLPKTEDLSPVKDYRPITCLNTSYKISTGMLAKYMKEHAMRNNVWDEGQLGAIDGVLGAVDQLLIDKCIVDEVREHKRNLAVAFYDYTKAYDRVHHDWMLREKLNKYQQLTFTTREKRPGYDVKILPMIIGCLGDGMQRLAEQVAKIIKDKNDVEGVCQNMQKTVLVESETIMNKGIRGIIQQS